MDLSYFTKEELVAAYTKGSPVPGLYFEDSIFYISRQEIEEELVRRG